MNPKDLGLVGALEELVHWAKDEPEMRRFDIRFVGEPLAVERRTSWYHWEVKVWSQREDGTPRREPGVGVGTSLNRAACRALDAWARNPNLPKGGDE